MMRRARISTDAEADLDEIYAHIARDHPLNAERWVARLVRRCDWLADTPEVGRARDDLRAGLRTWPEKAYLICYEIVPDGIRVLRVFRGDLDIDRVFGQSAD